MTAQPKQAKGLPKARVLFASSSGLATNAPLYYQFLRFQRDRRHGANYRNPVACIPTRTRKQAREIVRLHAMSKGKLIETIVRNIGGVPGMSDPHGRYYDYASAVLKALGLGGQPQ